MNRLASADIKPSIVAPEPELSGFQRLQRIVADLESGSPSPQITVRQFLEWFGAVRRGQWIVSGIRGALAKSGLVTLPDFEQAFIDASISFLLAADAERRAATAQGSPVSPPVPVSGHESAVEPAGISDPTYRISKLAAANAPPVYVQPDRPLSAAITLMLQHDFSQLPVMTNERTVKGAVSWRSIGSRWALDRDGQCVRDFMEKPAEVSADSSIFAVLPIIVDQGYVLVRDATNRVTGIITTTDLSLQFRQLAEPFLLLGEIENHIRRLMDGKFTVAELAAARGPADSKREITSVFDLGFGEYLQLLQNPEGWQRLAIGIDRTEFVKQLDKVRVIRNEVMHFDPDPLPEADLATLRGFARFLQALQTMGF